MKPIEPQEYGAAGRARMDSTDLKRLAQEISGRLKLECPRCRQELRPTVTNRELRLGSSPDLSALNPEHVSRPRLLFYCSRCRHIAGWIQGEEWAAEDREGGVEEPTRWDRLELDEAT